MNRWEVWKAYQMADVERRAILDFIIKQILEGERKHKGRPCEVVDIRKKKEVG